MPGRRLIFSVRLPHPDVPLQIDSTVRERLEQKGRGLAVFQCSRHTSFSSLEALPETCVISSSTPLPELTGTERRILLKLGESDLSRLRIIVNTILLPAIRGGIPLYLLAQWHMDTLQPVPLPMPDRARLDESLEPLWREQMRSLLANVCVFVTHPGVMDSVLSHGMTPAERYLAAGLEREGWAYQPQAVVGPHTVDFLLPAPAGGSLVIETDGRSFYSQRQRDRDAALMSDFGLKVIRFNGIQLLQDRKRCIDAIRLCRMGGVVPGDPAPMDPGPALSPEQAACLVPHAGPMLTLAPAGSGKTRVLTRRVVEAAHNGVHQDRILCVVFNKAASLVMAERIHLQANLPGVRICTLHSLGYDIARNAPGSPYAGYRVVTPTTLPGGLYRLYRNVLRADSAALQQDGLPGHRFFPEHLVMAYEEAVSQNRRTLMPLAAAAADTPGFDAEQLDRISQKVDAVLRTSRLLTYDEQIYRAVEVLLCLPEARRKYTGLYDVVLVDEVQDLTPIQFLLVRLMALPANNLFAVGDDDQMINTFTGADPANIRAFREWYPGAAIRTLGENYRCAPDIVTRSANVITYNRQRVPKPIRPAEKTGHLRFRAVHIVRSVSLEKEALAMVNTVRGWVADGYAYRDIGVLVRVKSLASPVQFALKEGGIPFLPLEQATLYTSSVGKVIGAYLTICRHPETATPEAYARALSVPSRYLSNDHLRAVGRQGWSLVQNFTAFPGYAQPGLKAFVSRVHQMRTMNCARGTTPVHFLDTLVQEFGISSHFRIRDQTTRRPAVATAAELIDLIRQMAASCADVSEFIERYGQRSQVESELKGSGETTGEDRVTVTTIHRSKGGEYRGVILFHVAEQTLPHRRMVATAEDIEEERRVFYVGVTRAIEQLCITTDTRRASRFLAELDQPFETPRRLGAIGERLLGWRWIQAIRRLKP